VAKPKILLVDDTRLVLELEKSFLKFSHVDVVTAGNGVEALELIRRDPPDLIFMDLNMPEMDGISCCTLLKADPFLCGIPVIMLTTAGREQDRESARKAGCDDFLTKPIDRREFLDKAHKYTDAVDRRAQRVSCRFPVISLYGNIPIGVHALDISDGGLFLASREQLLPGRQLKLALYLPTAHPVLLELKGKVAWLNEEGKRVHAGMPTGFGVEFLELEEPQIALLRAFVEAGAAGSSGGAPA